ncbi:MAG TPA: hypothetical protein VIW69_15825 [Candidatus Elarobacter sp.]
MDILSEMSAKYIWWRSGDGQPFRPRRVLAQVMDIGDYGDVLRVLENLGEEPLRDVLAHAEAGWFKPRSWSYWHYRLGVVDPGGPIPPLPKRALP